MKRKLLVAVPLSALAESPPGLFPKHELPRHAYISERSVTLWSSVAQVREPIDTLHYGTASTSCRAANDTLKSAGQWRGRLVDSGFPPDRPSGSAASSSLNSAKPCPCRPAAAPGADQFLAWSRTQQRALVSSAVAPIEVVARAVADWVQGDEHENARENDAQEKKKERWFLVRGWLLARTGRSSSARTSESNTTTQPRRSDHPHPRLGCARSSNWIADPVRESMASAMCADSLGRAERVASPSEIGPQYLVAGTRSLRRASLRFHPHSAFTPGTRKRTRTKPPHRTILCGQIALPP